MALYVLFLFFRQPHSFLPSYLEPTPMSAPPPRLLVSLLPRPFHGSLPFLRLLLPYPQFKAPSRPSARLLHSCPGQSASNVEGQEEDSEEEEEKKTSPSGWGHPCPGPRWHPSSPGSSEQQTAVPRGR